ncbi:hypothetical protein IT575_13570 [bacterium]|nr:hypothetical protein [bacterium]
MNKDSLKQMHSEAAPEPGALPAALEAGLRSRLAAAGDLPGLARQVQLRLECREQAKLWLARNGGLRYRQTALRRRAQEARALRFALARRTAAGSSQPLLSKPQTGSETAAQPDLLPWLALLGPELLSQPHWRGLGASLAGGIVGYALLSGIPQPEALAWLAPVGGLSVAAAALLAVLALGASQWQNLRGWLQA